MAKQTFGDFGRFILKANPRTPDESDALYNSAKEVFLEDLFDNDSDCFSDMFWEYFNDIHQA